MPLQPSRRTPWILFALVGSCITAGSVAASGQPEDAPEAQHALSALTPLAELEREARRIFSTFFKRTRNTQMHEQGWAELDPILADTRTAEILLGLFADEPVALRRSLLDRYADLASEDGDTVLAWVAVFDEDEELRAHASARLIERVGDTEPAHGVQVVLSEGLKSPQDEIAVSAAELVRAFDLLRAVPQLVQAQAQPRRGGDDVRTGALAQIVVGTQQAFVQDLTPVVANNAVGFQPTIGVVSSGTVLRVMDAVVWEYRTQVHRVLVDMTSAAVGESTARLGYDAHAWLDWYAAELRPILDERDG
ncbi:MAG: hypothetical protein ACTS22_04765 [Phycisphaerales bacterium]